MSEDSLVSPLRQRAGVHSHAGSDSLKRWSGPEEIYNAHYDRLVAALTIAADDRDVALDAVQEAFVRLVANWPRVRRYEDPVGWVRRVALNQVVDHKRSLLRHAKMMARLRKEPEPIELRPSSPLGPELVAALRLLPAKQRIAIALYYVADLTVGEVAEAMGISEGSVNQHLHRARRALKESIAEE